MLKAYAVMAIVGTTTRMRIVSEVEKIRLQTAKEDASEFIDYPLPHENGFPLNGSGQTLDIDSEGREFQGRKVDDVIRYYFDQLQETAVEKAEPTLDI